MILGYKVETIDYRCRFFMHESVKTLILRYIKTTKDEVNLDAEIINLNFKLVLVI